MSLPNQVHMLIEDTQVHHQAVGVHEAAVPLQEVQATMGVILQGMRVEQAQAAAVLVAEVLQAVETPATTQAMPMLEGITETTAVQLTQVQELREALVQEVLHTVVLRGATVPKDQMDQRVRRVTEAVLG